MAIAPIATNRSAAMTIKSAIKQSANRVSIQSMRGYGWEISGPYRNAEPRGAYTTIRTTTYSQAQRAAAAWRAGIVLTLIGEWSDDVQYALEAHKEYSYATGHKVTDYVRLGMAEHARIAAQKAAAA